MHDENIKTGRVLVFLQFLIAAVVIASTFIESSLIYRQEITAVKIASVILIIFGVVIVLAALFTFNQRVTPNPVPLETARLRTNGIYGYIRHPMYSSVILFLIGFTLFERAYYSFFLNIVVVIFLLFKIKFEEIELGKHFPEYKSFQAKTKKLIPFIY
jgi:protein-S-isoprenylcysteine O-methyltransferase Ste14